MNVLGCACGRDAQGRPYNFDYAHIERHISRALRVLLIVDGLDMCCCVSHYFDIVYTAR